MCRKSFIIILLTAFSSCSHKSDLNAALEMAGENRSELEKVLNYYNNDALKYKAACFLIENLPYHYSYEGEAVNNYRKLYELHATGRYYPEKVLDSINSEYGHFSYNKAVLKTDLNISADYLIENIDWAFKVWKEQPWGKHVAFDEFCEYILPYRVGDEALVSWRGKIYEQFNPMLDSVRKLPEAEDPLFVSKVLRDSLEAKRPFLFSYIFDGPHVGPDIVNWYSGYCRESSDILMYVFRALGIPCSRDVLLIRGDRNTGHEWNALFDKNGNSYYGSITYASEGIQPVDTYWWKKGKVYRQTFSRNKMIRNRLKVTPEKVYPGFWEFLFTDVTCYYMGERNQAVIISSDKLYRKPEKNEPIYLCLASWLDWEPVALAYYDKEDNIYSPDVEGNIVFKLATYNRGKLSALTDPFLIDSETGDVRYFESGEEREEVVLLHKFELDYVFPWRMYGGVFEGSNTPDFSSKDTIFTITRKPARMWNVAKMNSDKKYRYVRYVGPRESHCNVSEIAFYANENDTISLSGKIIGTPNSDDRKSTHEYTNVFDGDPNTSFDYYLPDGAWVGLDIRTPQHIRKIVYTARNRDNFIRCGNLYELFYYQNGDWMSAGKIQAETDSLVYNVPKGALLYLKNHTYGKDERIFEYVNGEQIFR